MFTKHLQPVSTLLIAVALMLVAGCGPAGPRVPTVAPAFTGAGAGAEETSVPEPASQPTPATPVPASPTRRLPATALDSPVLAPTVAPVAQADEPYDDRGDPVRLLASYYDAVNRKEYQRAWAYWESPPSASYEQFVEGYAETASVLLVVRPPTREEGAAGSRYVAIPTMLVATHVDGSRHAFVGCYVARRPSSGAGDGLPGGGWSLYLATVASTPADTACAALLAFSCARP